MTPSLLNFDAMMVLARSNPHEFEKLTAQLRLEAASSFRSLEHGDKSLLEIELMLSTTDCFEKRIAMLSEELLKTGSQLPVLISLSEPRCSQRSD